MSVVWSRACNELITRNDEGADVSTVDVSMGGIELQDSAFVAAIIEGRESNSSGHQVLDGHRLLDQLDEQLRV